MLTRIAITITCILFSTMLWAQTEYKGLKCQYNDIYEVKHARFTLNGTMTVIDDKKATLSYSAIIFYLPGSDFGDYFDEALEENLVFASGKNLANNARYRGRKYNHHYKFELDWASVGGDIEYADLIISKAPVASEIDQYGATIETFTGALDVSYNDHHGDTVWVKCTRRYFKKYE